MKTKIAMKTVQVIKYIYFNTICITKTVQCLFTLIEYRDNAAKSIQMRSGLRVKTKLYNSKSIITVFLYQT